MGDLRYLADTKLSGFADAAGARPDRRGAGAARRSRAARRPPSRRRSSACATDATTGSYRAPTTARACATAPASWRWRPKRAVPRELIQAHRRRHRDGDARRPHDEHAGERLDGARRAGAAATTPKAIGADGRRHRASAARCYRTSRTRPLRRGAGTIANSGAAPAGSSSASPAIRSAPSRHLAGLRRRAQLLQARRHAGRPRAACGRTTASSTVLKVTEQTAQDGAAAPRRPAAGGLRDRQSASSSTAAPSRRSILAEAGREPTHAEYRDDRFVAAFDRAPSQPAIFTVAYIVRAVSPGRYVHPPATVEDMYRPERFGRTAFGHVEVAPPRP